MTTKLEIKVKSQSVMSVEMSVENKKMMAFKQILLEGPYQMTPELLAYIELSAKMTLLSTPVVETKTAVVTTELKPKTKQLSGWNAYMKATGHLNASMAETAAKWKAMSEAEQLEWSEKAKAMPAVVIKQTTGPKSKTGPKAKTNWHNYLAVKMPELKKMELISAQWKLLSDEQKKAYATPVVASS